MMYLLLPSDYDISAVRGEWGSKRLTRQLPEEQKGYIVYFGAYIDGLVQERRNSSELRLFLH